MDSGQGFISIKTQEQLPPYIDSDEEPWFEESSSAEDLEAEDIDWLSDFITPDRELYPDPEAEYDPELEEDDSDEQPPKKKRRTE